MTSGENQQEGRYALSNVGRELIRLQKDLAQEPTCLDLFAGLEALYGKGATDHTVEEASIVPEALAVGEQDHCIRPAYELTAHLEHGPVGVYGAFLIEHVVRNLGRVQDDDRLAEHSYRTDIACEVGELTESTAYGVQERTVCFSPPRERLPLPFGWHVEDIAD